MLRWKKLLRTKAHIYVKSTKPCIFLWSEFVFYLICFKQNDRKASPLAVYASSSYFVTFLLCIFCIHISCAYWRWKCLRNQCIASCSSVCTFRVKTINYLILAPPLSLCFYEKKNEISLIILFAKFWKGRIWNMG